MKKILIVISCLGLGGGERSLINLLNMFNYSKYSVDLLLLTDGGPLAKQIPTNVKILKKDPELHFLYNKFRISDILNKKAIETIFVRYIGTAISRLKESNINRSKQYRWEHFYGKYLKKRIRGYNTVFAYMNDDAMYYVGKYVDAPNKVAWIHNDYYAMGYNAEVDRRYFKKFNTIVTISDECLKILKEVFPTESDKFKMIPNLSSRKIIENQSRIFIPDEYKDEKRIKLLSVGRLSEQKGYDMAIDAAEFLKKEKINFCWFILGDGELRKKIEKSIVQRKLQDVVKLLGIRENPYPYIAQCDIFVQPSRFEGKSVVLDEARILCKPIVVTNYATVYDQIDDSNGCIVKMDGKSIAEGIKELILNEEKRNSYVETLQTLKQSNEEHIQDYYNLIR